MSSPSPIRCLLFLVHDTAMPDVLELRRSSPPIERTPNKLYAMLPHIQCFERLNEIFIQNGISVLQDQEIDSLLVDAIKNDRVEITEIFLNQNPDNTTEEFTIHVESCDRNIFSPEFVGCKISVSGFVFFMYHLGDFQNVFDAENLSITKQLACLKADLHCRSLDGSWLHFATKYGDESVARLLLECGAQANCLSDTGETPLHMAVESEVPVSILDTLIQHGADVNARIMSPGESNGVTPLHLALHLNHQAWIAHLLENGALIDSDSDIGHILLLAVESNAENLDTVLSHKPDPESPGNKAAFRAALKARYGEHRYNASKLVDYGFRLTPDDMNNPDIVTHALALGNPKIMLDLLKWGVSVYYRGNVVQDLIIRAIKNGQPDCLMFLLELDDSFNSESLYFSVLSRADLKSAENILRFGDLRLDFTLQKDHLDILEQYYFVSFIKAIQNHVSAVMALDLNINKKFVQNSQFLQKDKLPAWLLEAVSMPFPEDCLTQVAAMKDKNIGDTNISLYDVFNMSTHQIAGLLRNSSVTGVNFEDYAEMFPVYSDMIRWRFRRAFYRKNLIEQAMKIFDFLFKLSPNLLDEVKEKIIEYLTNVDLLILNGIRESSGGTANACSGLQSLSLPPSVTVETVTVTPMSPVDFISYEV